MDCKIAENLRKASRLITRYLDNKIKECGITYTQLYLLNEIKEDPTIIILSKASELGMDRSTLSRNIMLLEKNGLVERKKDSNDKRLFNIKLSHRGLECISNGISILKEANKEIENKLGETCRINQKLSSISKKLSQLK